MQVVNTNIWELIRLDIILSNVNYICLGRYTL